MLSAVPRAELEWLAAHGSLKKLDTGEIVSRKGALVEALYIVFSGRLALFVNRGAGITKVIEWRAGDITGMLPYSRLTTPPGNTIVQEPLELLAVHRDHLREMTRECVEVTSILVHTMLDRARLFTTSDLHNEKMISLGKLSAGLAHELNNPASAIQRCAAMLTDRIEECEEAARTLAAVMLNDTQMAAVDAIHAACLAKKSVVACSPLEQCDREEAIAGWLADHGLDMANATMLADTEVTFEALNQVAAVVQGSALNAVLRWAAAGRAVRNLAGMIQESTMHIAGLVTAVKGFTNMDQAMVAEPVDLAPNLNNTVTVLRSKALEKNATVTLELEADLPKVRGYAGELNQMWGNLIDNALDAVAHGGTVTVSAARDDKSVVVRVVDDGAGIPAEICGKVFDPFFTTKPQGHGTGLGLDIVRRLVRHNDGVVDFESEPGRTEFWVRLPVAEG